MKDSPRGYNLHFNSVCLNFGLKLCISDECVYIKIESNDKRNKETPAASLDVLTSQTTCIAPEHRIHKDCYYALCILIVSTYVDDNLIFTNSRTFADEFAAHCNKSLKMNLEGKRIPHMVSHRTIYTLPHHRHCHSEPRTLHRQAATTTWNAKLQPCCHTFPSQMR